MRIKSMTERNIGQDIGAGRFAKKGAHSASTVPDGAAVGRDFDERLVFRPCLLPGYKSPGKCANDAVVTLGSRNASLVLRRGQVPIFGF